MGVSLQVTLGSTATQTVAGGNAQGTCAPYVTCTWTNQASGNAEAWLAIGAANVGNGKGIPLFAGGGSYTHQPGGPIGNSSDATLWYLFGTNGNKIDVTLT